MDLEFVERCNVNLEFRIKNEQLERKFRIRNSEIRGSHRICLQLMLLNNLGLAIGAPPKAFLATTLLATGMERKRKGGSSDLPASFFAVS